MDVLVMYNHWRNRYDRLPCRCSVFTTICQASRHFLIFLFSGSGLTMTGISLSVCKRKARLSVRLIGSLRFSCHHSLTRSMSDQIDIGSTQLILSLTLSVVVLTWRSRSVSRPVWNFLVSLCSHSLCLCPVQLYWEHFLSTSGLQ